MGRLRLILRIAFRDLRRRRTEAALLLLVITAASTTLALGLSLRDVTSQPYERTRAATAAPDVVLRLYGDNPPVLTDAQVKTFGTLAQRPGVTAHSGPYPSTWGVVRANGHSTGTQVLARDTDPAAVDQPKLTAGSWIGSDGSVVMEATLAQALGVGVGAGDRITVSDKQFTVSGLAVSAAIAPFPAACLTGCELSGDKPQRDNGGLIWATRADTRSLASTRNPLYYLMNLKLANPGAASAFAERLMIDAAPSDTVLGADPWTDVQRRFARTTDTVRSDLLVGSSLLGLLAVASVAVLVGGRMADQTRRVGLLKAVGGTPRLVAMVLLAEYVVVALVAAGAGIGISALVAPRLTGDMAGLLGTSAAPPVTGSEAAVVVAATLAVAIVATFIPAVRAARTSTVQALANTAQAPKRRGGLIALSARLPVPMLLGLRLAARRPRRVVLAAASVAVTVSGIVAVLMARQRVASQRFSGPDALANPLADRLGQTMLVITVMIGVLALVNAVFIVGATVLDARRSSAVARALGANAGQVGASLVYAQAIPVAVGALLGVPGGLTLFNGVGNGGSTPLPNPVVLVAVVLVTIALISLLTWFPARAGARRPVAEVLQAEAA